VGNFLRSIVYKGTFDGDEVEITLRPLQFKDALRFRGLEAESIAQTLMEVLPEYITEVKGLRAADGSAVTREELLSSSYFTPVLVNAGLELVQNASVKNP
jgi:hypothetical protein